MYHIVTVCSVLSLQDSQKPLAANYFLLTNQFFHVFCIFCKEPVHQIAKQSCQEKKLGLWYSFIKKNHASIYTALSVREMQGKREKDRKRNYNYHKKNTKDSIPYDEKTGIVFVYTVWISPMMHSVVTRGVQYVFQRTQRFYILKKENNAQCSVMDT